MPPDFVSTQEAAELLGIHESRVRALAAEGRIRGALKVGRAWIIPLGADGKPQAKILPTGRPPKGKTRR
ncbi:MAG: helix-turn-helix domain-containing protein [bacterium]